MRGEYLSGSTAASTLLLMDPHGQQQQSQSPSSGSFYLNPPVKLNGAAIFDSHATTMTNGINIQQQQQLQRGESNKSTMDSVVGGGKSTSTTTTTAAVTTAPSKKRSSKKRGGSKNNNSLQSEDYLQHEMPTALGGGNDLDRINQLMARFTMNGNGNGGGGGVGGGVGQPAMGAYNMFAGYQKGDDLVDLVMAENGQRKYHIDGSPVGDHSWNRGGGGGGGAMPHPMMMMPGQQNLMTNYFTPGLMVKTPNSFMNTDYASLPPAINLSHSLSLLEEDDNVDVGGVRGQRLNEKLRFSSDPGGSDNENVSSSGGERPVVVGGGVSGGGGVNRSKSSSKRSPGDSNQSNESTSSGSSGTGASGSLSETQHRQHRSRSSRSGTGPSMGDPNGRILGTLLEQINLLHETNSKICRNLHDTKVEIEALKHAPSWGLRHRRDSISGLSTHSQPLGYAFGTQSPAPASFHSGAYTPGMMTDVVREVREGARIREEAMLNRVKTLVDERTWQANELNYKLQREVEELKGQVHELRKEKQETGHRLSELELEIKTMRIVFGAQLQALGGVGAVNGSASQLSIAQQVAAATLQRNSSLNSSSGDSRQQQAESTPVSSRRGHLNIKYGVLNEQDSPMEVLSGGGGGGGAGGDEKEAQEVELMEKLVQKYKYGGRGGTNQNNNSNNSITTNGNGEVVAETESHVVMQMEKDTFDLRRELQDAVAGKKSAEQRILTLEREMQNMQDSMGRRTSEPIKLNHFSKSENVLNRFAATNGGNGVADVKQRANTVQTVVVGSTVATSPPRGNGFCLTGPVTDL